jgi:hypothetical protein
MKGQLKQKILDAYAISNPYFLTSRHNHQSTGSMGPEPTSKVHCIPVNGNGIPPCCHTSGGLVTHEPILDPTPLDDTC